MTSQQMAALMNKLQAPLAVSDILTGRSPEDCSFYALSELISEMQPDEAMLAVSFSLRMIVKPYLQASPSIQSCDVECQRIIRDYAPIWAETPLSEMTDSDEAINLLEDLIDDFSYLSELTDLCIHFLTAKDLCAVELFNLLKAQIDAQIMIAQTLCSHFDCEESTNALFSNEDSAEIISFSDFSE